MELKKENSSYKPFHAGKFFIIAIICIFLINGCAKKSPPKPAETAAPAIETVAIKPAGGLLAYESPKYGINIKYPSNWIKKEEAYGTAVAFIAPPESDSDTFRENVNIIVQDLSSQPMTLDDYTKLSLGQIKNLIKDIKFLESAGDTLSGNPAYRVVYTGKHGETELKWLQIWTTKNNKAYVFTYTAVPDKYSNYLDAAQEMIKSFEIL